MTSSAVNTRWWPTRWSGHGLTNQTGSAGPVDTVERALVRPSNVLAVCVFLLLLCVCVCVCVVFAVRRRTTLFRVCWWRAVTVTCMCTTSSPKEASVIWPPAI